jgi:hypothetical protein
LFHSFNVWSLNRHREKLRLKLANSGLVERLIVAGLPHERAVDYVPFPFHLAFPQLRSNSISLAGEFKMIGANLDWYLNAPRTLLRFHWFLYVLYPLCMSLVSGLSLQPHAAAMTHSQLQIQSAIQAALMFLMNVPRVVFAMNSDREAVRKALLGAELLSRID